jgi:transposase-like protein
MKRNVNRFPDELKLKIVNEYLTTDCSQQFLMEKYGFTGQGNIKKWMAKH